MYACAFVHFIICGRGGGEPLRCNTVPLPETALRVALLFELAQEATTMRMTMTTTNEFGQQNFHKFKWFSLPNWRDDMIFVNAYRLTSRPAGRSTHGMAHANGHTDAQHWTRPGGGGDGWWWCEIIIKSTSLWFSTATTRAASDSSAYVGSFAGTYLSHMLTWMWHRCLVWAWCAVHYRTYKHPKVVPSKWRSTAADECVHRRRITCKTLSRIYSNALYQVQRSTNGY